jgi:hypothetical protein
VYTYFDISLLSPTIVRLYPGHTGHHRSSMQARVVNEWVYVAVACPHGADSQDTEDSPA